MSDLATELSRFMNAAADLAKAKVNQKDTLTALGQTVDNDWSTYPEKLSAVSGATVQDSKTVKPNPAGMEILPDDGYGAMLKVILAAEPNFQPWNIAAGIQIWGKTGTARPYVKPGGTDWPDVPATEEEMDEVVQEDDESAPVEDKFVLMDNKGNVTTGYMYTEENSGLCVYGSKVLPDIDSVYTDELKAEYPYAIMVGVNPPTLVLSTVPLSFKFQSANNSWPSYYGTADGSVIAYCDWNSDDEGWSRYRDKDKTFLAGELAWGALLDYPFWANYDLLNEDGTVKIAASEPTEYTGFTITHYDPVTTEFRAIGWRRVSKHTTGADAGTITKDDFTRQESGGWNYLKNIRSCTREKLYYQGVEVWPKGSEKWDYNGNKAHVLPKWDKNVYPYATMSMGFGEYLLRLWKTVPTVGPYSDSNKDDALGSEVATEYLMYNAYFVSSQDQSWRFIGSGTNNAGVHHTVKPFWSNFDLYRTDGTLFLAASEPTPV